MDEAALRAALAAAEEDVAQAVSAALRETADEFARALDAADEIVAARFSVARIARMWSYRTRRVVARLLGVAETAAQHTATAAGRSLPDGWDDLPGRYDDGTPLPAGIGAYVETTEHLLRAVGDRLAETARAELADGVSAGETTGQLRARLLAAFDRDGAQLGRVREERIARTEATRAWNTATLAAARAVEGPGRPLVKQWVAHLDDRTREAHRSVHGQLRLLDEPFTVAGVPMAAPGDPTAPAGQVINCRCVLAVHPEPDRTESTPASDSQTPGRGHVFDSQEEPAVSPKEPSPAVVAAADGSHRQGAMIALIPTEADAARLALDSGEPADELHLTLFYLGEADGWSQEAREELTAQLRNRAQDLGQPIPGRAFGANHWNADSDTPSWVWAVGDDRDHPDDAPRLNTAHWAAVDALECMNQRPDLPKQHSPWAGHVCAIYTGDTWPLEELNARLGPITFDRIRVAFAGEHTDIPLGPPEEAPMPQQTAAAMPTRPWSTPDGTAIAFENQETGDGRIFAPGALYWSGPGPWPLQYADEMLMGHEGAELAGAIQSIGRNADRITATGVLYPARPAGADALMLLQEDAPLGISVDLDDVSVEFVDRTLSEEDAGFLALAASLPSMSLLHMEDGSWSVTASTTPEWTASGGALTRRQHNAQLITGPGGQVPAAAVYAAFGGALTAAAGDTDDPGAGLVVHSESSGDLLLRITRARVRGATLVAMPAYDQARIVLDPLPDAPQAQAAATPPPGTVVASGEAQQRVVAYVCGSPVPVGAREVAQALGISMDTARGHLARAAAAGRLVRLARGIYTGPSSLPEGQEATASLRADTGPQTPGHDTGQDEEDHTMRELEASAWTAMRDTDPMPAAWFREPTPEELPPGSGGVHYAGGRIYGWVAQAGEPHAGYPGRNLTIESLGNIDLTHFLRARFPLDDGTLVKAGAFTMNAPHHRDGAECESAACQFDDTRTVAGIVTVGMNDRGMWFSGAAAPWLSEWDRSVFQACQPSYHMKQGPGGRWQLRAVLSVPVPGHSSPLLASAVAERANLALAASAALTSPDTVSGAPDTVSGQGSDTVSGQGSDTVSGQEAATAPGGLAETVAALLTSPAFLDSLTAALDRREAERTAARAEVERLSAAVAPARHEIAAALAGTVKKGTR